MTSVLIADNQTLTRQGLLTVFTAAKGIQIVGQATALAELKQSVMALQPDVVLLDAYYDNNFTMDSLRLIQDQLASSRILIVSNRYARHEILHVIHHGIRNYVSKDCTPDELIEAVYATAKGEQFFCKKIVAQLDDALVTQPEESQTLSARENEIVHLIADGKTNKEIAHKLFLSIHTVRTHRKNIIKKLGFTFKNASDLMLVLDSQPD